MRFLNKFYDFIEKIGKHNFILIIFIFIVLLVTGLYQTFSLYTTSDGLSVIDGIKTYSFILNASNETNSVIIAANSSKNVDITVSNGSDANLKYGLYYTTTDTDNINIGYGSNTVNLPNGIISGNASYVVTVKVDNSSSSDITVNFGIKYGFENGGDLTLGDSQYWLDEYVSRSFYQAIYSETDNSLTFIYDTMLSVGDTYNSKVVSAVYTGFENDTYYGSSSVPWYVDGNYTNITSVSFETIVSPVSTAYWFYNMINVTSMNLTKLDISNVTTMEHMFYGCSSLTNLDLSSFDTSKVTNMVFMFYGCNSLVSLDISNFDTSNVTIMLAMFQDCSSLTNLNLSSFDTSKVTNMVNMFAGCTNLTNLDLSNFDTGKVTDMGGMFRGCSNLAELDLSSFDTGKVTGMSGMFYGCSNLVNLDLSSFDTSKVTIMSSMFAYCYKVNTTLTIRNANTSTYTLMFDVAATEEGSQIILNYTADTSDLVDNMIATGNPTGSRNVVKGILVS